YRRSRHILSRREFRELHFHSLVAGFYRQLPDLAARYAALADHKHLAVGTHNLTTTPERPVALRGGHADQDLVTWLKRILMPADAHQVPGAEHLDAPVFGLAFVVFQIIVKLSMGINPYQIAHGRLDGNAH